MTAEGVKARFVQLPGGVTLVLLKGSEIFCGNADAVLAQRAHSMSRGGQCLNPNTIRCVGVATRLSSLLFGLTATLAPELWASRETKNMEEFLQTPEVSGKLTESLHRVL